MASATREDKNNLPPNTSHPMAIMKEIPISVDAQKNEPLKNISNVTMLAKAGKIGFSAGEVWKREKIFL